MAGDRLTIDKNNGICIIVRYIGTAYRESGLRGVHPSEDRSMTHANGLVRQTHKARCRMIDAHIGQRVRLRRILLGFNQGDLGERLGVAAQQVQKYENGTNRIGASRLFDLANILDVPFGYFFDDLPTELQALAVVPRRETVAEDGLVSRRIISPEAGKFICAYQAIRNAKVRKRFHELVQALGKATPASSSRDGQ